ncbi:MAG: DUF1972 domain-containing protein [Planctomycetota bacterium]|nr:DUF1972 domain-containing protein [Planctomycetota bacterium]
MRIAIVGTRGIPARYGGFETFAAQVSPLLVAEHGLEVTVIGDASCESSDEMVGPVRSICSRYAKSASPIRYYRDSLAKAAEFADLTLVCGTPGGALAWSTRHKMLVAVNPDGLESRRPKWSRVVRAMFYVSERLSTWVGHATVCDSVAIESYYKKKHKARSTFVAEYGALENPFMNQRRGDLKQVLSGDGLEHRGYHLVVARIEPENLIREIVEGYRLVASRLRWPLLIVGDCTASPYGRELMSGAPASVSFLGSVYDAERLHALRAGACSYVHGHTVGGTNPSLLEAMASASMCICHENEFNRATTDGDGLFFENAEDLGAHLVASEQPSNAQERMRAAVMTRWQNNYTWELIAGKYAAIFGTLLERGGGRS